MNAGMEIPEKYLSEILKQFFSRKEIEEFSARLYKSVNKGISIDLLKKKDAEQLQFNIEQNYKSKIHTDIFITFAEKRLKEDKFLSLLLEAARLSIAEGNFNISLEIYEKILSLSNEKKSFLKYKADALLGMGDVFSRQAAWETSLKYINQAIDLYHRLDDEIGTARAANLTGIIFGDKGDLDKASECFSSALSRLENSKEEDLKGMIKINLGVISNLKEDYNKALKYFSSALDLFERSKNKKRITEVSLNIGITFAKLNDNKSALEYLDNSIILAQELNHLTIIGIAYLNKSSVYISMENFEAAEVFANKALGISYRINDKLSIAEVFKLKGIIERRHKNYEISENYLLTSLRMNKELENRYNEAEAANELGILYYEMNKIVESTYNFSSAVDYFKIINAVKELKKLDTSLKSCKNFLQANLIT